MSAALAIAGTSRGLRVVAVYEVARPTQVYEVGDLLGRLPTTVPDRSFERLA
jgi:hypothetical protein